MGFPKNQIFVALCVYIGQMMVGYGSSWTAPMLPKLQDPDQSPLPDAITDQQASWIGSSIYIGCIIGALVIGVFPSGRKPFLFLGSFTFILSFLILALAKNLAMIFVGRILTGLGIGITLIMNLVYVGEIASTHIRGILLTVLGIFFSLGSLTVFSVAPYVSFSVTSYIGGAIALVYFCVIIYIPESPLYLITKGDETRAKDILTFLGRPEDIEKIKLTSKQELDNKRNVNRWSELFTDRSNRRAFFITQSLNLLQQMSGAGVVFIFVTTILQAANSSIEPYIATIIVGITQVTSSCITPFFIERTGRKILLLISSAACCLSLVVMGTYFYLDSVDSTLAASVQWLPLASLTAFFLSYDIGLGVIPDTLIGEMYTPNARSAGSTITITIGWLVGFGVITAFGYMLPLGAHFAFWFYAAACAAAFIFTIAFVPETQGKSLAEIQEMLSR